MSDEASPTPALSLRGLRREFGGQVAVEDLTLDIPHGEIFGFIGPNGSGKTTTIRMLATLLEPTSGEAFVDGISVRDAPEEVRRRIGYLPDSFGVYEGNTVEEYLEFYAAAARIPAARRAAVVRDVLALTDLGGLRERLATQLSRGMKQRLCLARTLVHDPTVLILDEPASALDPRSRIELRELLKELQSMGKTIFISSHILTELSDLCSSVGILARGRLQYTGRLEEVQRRSQSGHRVEIRFLRPEPDAEELLRSHPAVAQVSIESGGASAVIAYTGDPAAFHTVVKRLVDRGLSLQTIREAADPLEKLFLDVTDPANSMGDTSHGS